MNIDLSKVLEFLNSLYGLPKSALVFFFCLALCTIMGFVIRRIPWLPNYIIPIAVPCVVPFAGMIFLIGCSRWEISAIPTVWQYVFINLMVGFIIGAAAVVVDKYALSKVIARFKTKDDTDPALKKSDLPPDPPASDPMSRAPKP